MRRRGTTSLGWPKPKLRLSFPKGQGLAVWEGDDTKAHALVRAEREAKGGGGGEGGLPHVRAPDLLVSVSLSRPPSASPLLSPLSPSSQDINSLYGEVTGYPSTYVREAAAFAAYARAGVPAPRTRHAVLALNGIEWGLILLVERMDGAWLARVTAPATTTATPYLPTLAPGPAPLLLFKPVDATAANLRPDVGGGALRMAWSLAGVVGPAGKGVAGRDPATVEGAWEALEGLAAALAGGRGGWRGRAPHAPRVACGGAPAQRAPRRARPLTERAHVPWGWREGLPALPCRGLTSTPPSQTRTEVFQNRPR